MKRMAGDGIRPDYQLTRMKHHDFILVSISSRKEDERPLHSANAGSPLTNQRVQFGPLIRGQLDEVLLQWLSLAPARQEESTT